MKNWETLGTLLCHKTGVLYLSQIVELPYQPFGCPHQTKDNWEFFIELTEKSDWTKGTVVGQLLRDTIQLAHEIEEEICQRWNLE